MARSKSIAKNALTDDAEALMNATRGMIRMACASSVAAALMGATPATRPVVMPANVPDPLVCLDGTPVTTADQWRNKRRPELLDLFAREMYGRSPGRPAAMAFDVFDTGTPALGGKAVRRQVAIYPTGRLDGPRMDLLLYLPANATRPVPVIFGLNFWGNHAVTIDPGVRLTESYVEGGRNGFIDLSGVKNNRATDATRGIDAKRWPIEKILERGYGCATIYRGDIDPDLATGDAKPQGVRAIFPELQQRGDNFGAIAAWAWALSRGMDYLTTDAGVDKSRVAVFGWSRLGKAALWAAANDERFAALISSESGSGGAKLFHRDVGENIDRLCNIFPHWYCHNFRRYVRKETSLPFDMHEVIACVAPRPVYVASSAGSAIFDPPSDFLALKAAGPVYALLGRPGLAATEMPTIDRPVIGHLSYHWRTGGHDVLPFDWEQYLTFCDRHL